MCHGISTLYLSLGNVYLSFFELGFENEVKNFIKNRRPNLRNHLERLKNAT